jgi:uncharacterized membrane protein
MKLFKSVSIAILSFGYIYVGIQHFYNPSFFLAIMPPYLPFHLPLVYTSGAIEIALGIGLLFKNSRKYAAWGLIALLLAVYPANIYLALNEEPQQALGISEFLASWIRLPLQFVMIAFAYWHSIVDTK